MRKILLFIALISSFSVRSQYQSKPLKHVVIITFIENADSSKIKEVDDSFKRLSHLVMVKEYDWGISVQPKESHKIQHIYSFTFSSTEELDKYGKSREHQAHILIGKDIIDNVNAVDYFLKD